MLSGPTARDALHLALGVAGVFLVVGALHAAGHVNPTTAAVLMLVVILVTAAFARLAVAILASTVAVGALNFFFFPPLYTFTIADATNWIALFAFLTVSVVASQLSAAARARAHEAIARRTELAQLYDLSRDVLLTTESAAALDALPGHIARRFRLPAVALCVPHRGGAWSVHQGGRRALVMSDADLTAALATVGRVLEFDARERTYGGQTLVNDPSGEAVALVPLRLGPRAIGLVACPQGALETGTLDALAGLAAIALERIELLSARQDATLAEQRANLASALLASLSHDLRTPLTAASVAIANLRNPNLDASRREAQAVVAQQELDRLARLMRDILDMARIDASAVTLAREWVTPADVVDAALANLGPAAGDRRIDVDADAAMSADVDPRLTTTALSHLVENAMQYSPADRPIVIRGWIDSEGLHFTVRDFGPGLDPQDLAHVFERFYRGHHPKTAGVGTGMGLAITRGLLAAEGGRVWGENVDDGALFSIVVPAATHAVTELV